MFGNIVILGEIRDLIFASKTSLSLYFPCYLVADSEAGDDQRYWEGEDEDSTESTETSGELSQCWDWLVVISHRGEGQQAPPDTVVERPDPALAWLHLEGKHEGGEHDDGHQEDDQDQTDLPVGLVYGVEETLETNKVSNHPQDPQDSHDSHQSDYLAGFPDNLEIQLSSSLF